MENKDRIISTALCQYRFYNVKRFTELLGKAARYNKDNGHYDADLHAIYMHKAMKAGIEAHDTNDLIGVEMPYHEVWERDLLTQVLALFEAKADNAYANAEAMAEDRALTKFHNDAYGGD